MPCAVGCCSESSHLKVRKHCEDTSTATGFFFQLLCWDGTGGAPVASAMWSGGGNESPLVPATEGMIPPIEQRYLMVNLVSSAKEIHLLSGKIFFVL
jgi:hypothetical protein